MRFFVLIALKSIQIFANMKGVVEYCANEIWQAGSFWQKHLGLIRDNEPKVHTSSSDDKAIRANVIYPQTSP